MATPAQRARRRRQRANRAQRARNARALYPDNFEGPLMGPSRARGRGGRRQGRNGRNSRGFLSNLGNALLPGLGGTVGQIGDNILGGFLGGRANSAPVATAGRSRAVQMNYSRESGVEELAVISVRDGTPAGTILTQYLLAAPLLGVRLAKFASLWTKTTFLKLHFEVVSSNPSVIPGNYTVAIDPDPVQFYESGPELPARLMALTNAARANAWASAEVNMYPNPVLLYNKFDPSGASDAEIRQYACGQFIMATTTAYTEAAQYTIQLHWEVLFEKPDTAPSTGLAPNTFGLAIPFGRAGTWNNTTPGLVFLNSTDCWLDGKMPPDGTYTVANLDVLCRTSGGAEDNVDGIAVVVVGTTTAINSVGSTLPEGPITVAAQLPPILIITAAPVTGFAKLSLHLKPEVRAKHQAWFDQAQIRVEKERHQSLINKVRDEMLLETIRKEMKSLDIKSSKAVNAIRPTD